MLQFSRRYGITLLIAFLFCIYTFTNAGHFHIVDEVSLFAVTESLALRGSVDTNTIAWTQWVNSPGEVLGAFGSDGKVYSKKGPAPAFLAVPWYVLLRLFAQRNIAFGLLQGTLLWNGLVTAVTAALLWLTAIRLGYKERTGLLLGLLFGVGTIAWPYANHYFGEPLSALALLACYYGILAWRQSHSYGWLWLSGISGGIAITTVTAHLPLIMIFEIYLFYVTWQEVRNPQPAPTVKGTARKEPLPTTTLAWGAFHFLAPIALAGMMLLWYNLVRFGSPFATGYHFESGEGFTTPIWQGLWGLLFSPYRGIFWHTPLLIASLIAFPRFWRRHRSDGWVILALSVTLLVLYSMWWMWWGGFAWGPRFLVPLTPFLVLVLAELLQSGVQEPTQSGWHTPSEPAPTSAYDALGAEPNQTSLIRYDATFASTAQSLAHARTVMPIWLGILAGLSVIVQMLAVSLNYVNYETQLRTIFPTDWRDPLAFGPPAQAIGDLFFSPVIGQLRLLRQGWLANSDLVWLPADGDVKWLLVMVGVAALVTLLYLLRDWWRWVVDFDPEKPGFPIWGVIPLIPLLLLGVWLGETAKDPHYGEPNSGYRLALDTLCAQAKVDDGAVSIAPTAYQIPMNWFGATCRVGVPLYGYATDSATHPEAVMALERLLATSKRLWYITGGLQANDPENSVERWLSQNGYKATDDWYGDYRLVRYATEKQLEGTPSLPHNAQLSTLTAEGVSNQITIIASKAPVAGSPGDFIPIRIEYLLNLPVPADLRWFVQILNQEGAAVAQLDTGPEDNYVAFSTLPINQLQIERAGLTLPADLPEGQYRLIAGLYSPAANGERLRLSDGSDTVLLSFITVD